MEKQWEDFYLGGFFKRVETTASQKAKSTEQARVCDDVFLHVHYVYVCLIRRGVFHLGIRKYTFIFFAPFEGDHLKTPFKAIRP